jgi:hypothetical protein
MKYVVNQRGGCKIIDDKDFDRLSTQGFIEITQDQYNRGYLPEFDKGPSHQAQPVFPQKIQKPQEQRTHFETIVAT